MNLILFIARFLLISRNGATTFVTVVYNRKFHNKYLTHIILHKVVVLLFLSLSLLWKFSNEIFFFRTVSRFHGWRNLGTFDCIIVFISRYSSYFRNNKNGMELRKDNREEEKEIVFINFLIFTSLISFIYRQSIPSLI